MREPSNEDPAGMSGCHGSGRDPGPPPDRGGTFRLPGGTDGCLLLHGLTGTTAEMRPLGERLHRDGGFTVAGVLLAGHGRDAATFQATGWPEWYRSAEGEFRNLRASCGPLFLVGFSMGGLLALRLAILHPADVRAVALLATPLFADGRKARLAAILLRLPGLKGGIARTARKRAGRTPPPLHRDLTYPQASFAQLKGILRREAVHMRRPALILHSKRDPSVPWENALFLHRLVSSPRKRLLILSRSLHVLPLDEERDLVAEEILGFFRSVQREDLSSPDA